MCSISLLVVCSGVVINILILGQNLKKKVVSLICCNDGVLSALCHFPYPYSGITCN